MTDLTKFMQPLRKETLQHVVYDQLCQLILQGGLAPGQSVTVASLATALDVSPMPVREALSRLMAAGALTTVSGRSMGVPKLGREDLDDIKRVRIEIESLALKWAIEQYDKDFCTQTSELLGQLIAVEKNGDTPTFIDLNYQFHFTIYKHANSPLLLDIIQNLWLRISPYFHLLNARGHLSVSNEFHSDILSAIIRQDADAAVHALRKDIERAYDKLVLL